MLWTERTKILRLLLPGLASLLATAAAADPKGSDPEVLRF